MVVVSGRFLTLVFAVLFQMKEFVLLYGKICLPNLVTMKCKIIWWTFLGFIIMSMSSFQV